MDMIRPFKVKPLGLEAEFRIPAVKSSLHELNKEDLVWMLGESLELLIHITDQAKQMRDYIESLQGKIEIDEP
jgi:hypothetical protein